MSQPIVDALVTLFATAPASAMQLAAQLPVTDLIKVVEKQPNLITALLPLLSAVQPAAAAPVKAAPAAKITKEEKYRVIGTWQLTAYLAIRATMVKATKGGGTYVLLEFLNPSQSNRESGKMFCYKNEFIALMNFFRTAPGTELHTKVMASGITEVAAR
jgi:hypothetical protein